MLLLISSLFLLLWGSDSGYRLLLDKVSTKFFNGKVEYIKGPINLNDGNNESVNLRSLSGRYIILDFWTSSCDICFQKFPEVQKLYDKIAKNSDMSIYSVYCFDFHNQGTRMTGNSILKEKGYSFPCLSMPTDSYSASLLSIIEYPTVLIIDKEYNMIIYRGNIESAKSVIDRLSGIK